MNGVFIAFLEGQYTIYEMSNELHDSSSPYGHETSVASIIASEQAITEIPSLFGVAVSSNKIKLLPIGFISDGVIVNDLHTEAINYAVSMNVDIITASYSDSSVLTLVGTAYQSAFDQGIVVISSAGNGGIERTKYPCAYDDSICIGGLAPDFSFSDDSVWGTVDFITFNEDINIVNKSGTLTKERTGTSYAVPQVTAAVAKIMSYDDSYDRDSVYDLLEYFAVDIGDSRAGHGYIDFKRLAESFIDIHTFYVTHPENETIIFEIVYGTDETTDEFTRGFIRYVYVDATRYSLFQEFSI